MLEISYKIGSLDRSFMALLHMIQIDQDKTNKIILILRRKMKSEKATMFYMILIHFVGKIFQEEFIRALNSVISNQERGHDMLENVEILIESKKQAT